MIIIVLGVVLLFASLILFSKLLKLFVLTKFRDILEASLYKNIYLAMFVGILFTAVVQSSSVTTSLMIPLAAASVIGIKQVFSVALGANVGTTITALLAALSTGNPNALTIALAHLLFNVLGILIFFPIPFMRSIPINSAKWLAKKSAQNRFYAIIFIFIVFFMIPGLAILVF